MFFAHIQYPIIDLRFFLNNGLKREIPAFPAPKANTWLRNFGHVRNRKIDTAPYYIAENFFCEAHNAVKFEQLPLFAEKKRYEYYHSNPEFEWMEYAKNPLFNKICMFRRFRSDGKFKSCFEIGLETNPGYYDVRTVHSELKEIFVNVKSYNEKRRIRVPLFELDDQICKLYEISTRANLDNPPVNAIYSGSPIVVYIDYLKREYDDCSRLNQDNFNTFPHRVFLIEGFRLYQLKINNDNCWMIVPQEYYYDKKLLASIRRALLAIALEKETLLSAYNFLLLNAGQNYINETAVLSFIKKTQEKLLKQVRFGIPQSPLVDTLFKIDFDNNRAFYYDIINLISKVGDKYIVNDFNKLFINLEFNVWRERILEQLKTTDDKEYRRKLKQLHDICITEDRDKLWSFIYKYKRNEICRNIFSNLVSNSIWECIKLLFI